MNGDTQDPDLGLNQQNPENGGNDGSLQGGAGVKATDNEPEAPVDGEPKAPADQAQSESAESNPIDNKPVKSMANGINALAADGVYTVGADKVYATPADALADTGGVRAADGLVAGDFWVMELHNDFTLGAELSIPRGMNLMIRSARGKHYTIDADKKSHVITMRGDNTSLTLADVTITGAYNESNMSGGGVFAMGDNISLTLKAGSVVSGNSVPCSNGEGGGVLVSGTGSSLTMEAGSEISGNSARTSGGGARVS
ncbi:MAG: hypothetical protein LBJ91_04465, partial [Clostridiales Family XIII bacterium]|nr:hypothetical protein [Clostridiales Family XIII bacterium]